MLISCLTIDTCSAGATIQIFTRAVQTLLVMPSSPPNRALLRYRQLFNGLHFFIISSPKCHREHQFHFVHAVSGQRNRAFLDTRALRVHPSASSWLFDCTCRVSCVLCKNFRISYVRKQGLLHCLRIALGTPSKIFKKNNDRVTKCKSVAFSLQVFA